MGKKRSWSPSRSKSAQAPAPVYFELKLGWDSRPEAAVTSSKASPCACSAPARTAMDKVHRYGRAMLLLPVAKICMGHGLPDALAHERADPCADSLDQVGRSAKPPPRDSAGPGCGEDRPGRRAQ